MTEHKNQHLPQVYAKRNEEIYGEDTLHMKDFIIGVFVGGIVGAAAGLLLAPKSGRDLREDVVSQAGSLRERSAELTSSAKEKTAELSSAAKEKTAELTSSAKEKTAELSAAAKEKTAEISAAAKEKTAQLSSQIKEQSSNLVDKVKEKTAKVPTVFDDGTVSSEGEEPIENMSDVAKPSSIE